MSNLETPKASLERDGSPPVPITGNCSLGRTVGNDVVLVDDRVSRRHATIHAQGDREFWLVDLGSRNGTYLNGRRVSQPTRLRDTDRVQIGPFHLTFRLGAGPNDPTVGTVLADQTQVDLRSCPCWLILCDIISSSALHQQASPEEVSVLVGGWFARCKEVIEENGGTINKYLGDGFFAYWSASQPALQHVAQALRDLRRLQAEGRPSFRVVVHHGRVFLGGIPSSGEESLAGPEVNFVFRQEKLAGELRRERLASAAASELLKPLLPAEAAGEHSLPGFPGKFSFFTF
ncbi:MAG: adenylate/guanylate cyclase domain-containing protein [Verrucomicrobiales bacterium]|nr:adenylate/guanylate cyclase domain-containing protein [Verrucomicrobiales bacterium]